jgi:GNAT superfamily N-acetyltransferase
VRDERARIVDVRRRALLDRWTQYYSFLNGNGNGNGLDLDYLALEPAGHARRRRPLRWAGCGPARSATDPAKVRAIYTHPAFTRRGVGRRRVRPVSSRRS